MVKYLIRYIKKQLKQTKKSKSIQEVLYRGQSPCVNHNTIRYT